METTPEDKKTSGKISYHKNIEYYKKYYIEHAELIRAKKKKYREENREEINRKRKEHYKNNRETIRKNWKDSYKKSSKKKDAHDRYVLKNSDKIKKYQNAYNKKYKKENSEKLKKLNREYTRNRRENDPIFKMVINLRRRINRALKAQGVAKDMKTKELFGATQEEVWKHLESKFKEGMTRKNNNPKGWHIDHIKPMSAFDLNDPKQLKECCHYTNLQPLWWWENLSKSDKILDNV